jgi:hypothetical protein
MAGPEAQHQVGARPDDDPAHESVPGVERDQIGAEPPSPDRDEHRGRVEQAELEEPDVERLTAVREGVPEREPALRHALREEAVEGHAPVEMIVAERGGPGDQRGPLEQSEQDDAAEERARLDETAADGPGRRSQAGASMPSVPGLGA